MGVCLSLTVLNQDGVSDLEIYANKDNTVSISEPNGHFYSEINKDDWDEMKAFIDNIFNE